ncbi:sensor histidine kinase [Actinomadura macrotermitis]|uniref:histidine kinase n=1 Tax=Actinomadura macrotermitis TaxID=2585200 RepID=A0A7K0BPA0_9ACTN|nr:HAMP domain-containing sensor histidine kinase [Actinomadura macrotermitis]MQY02957.1 Adaptive-response sensory-kinase SasA [Actinomadura macrotermitis]
MRLPRSVRARATTASVGAVGVLLPLAVMVIAVALHLLDVRSRAGAAGVLLAAAASAASGLWLARTLSGTRDRLERSMARQRDMAADASHELRTPLTGLRTRIELALAEPGDAAETHDTLSAALRDVERLQRIVEDLLDLARLDAGQEPARVRLDLGELVEEGLAARSPRIPVTAKIQAGVRVVADRRRLARALASLLANADRHAASRVEVTVRAEGALAVLEVRDDGPGIAPADRERVFERFTRLDAARSRDAGGSGLGLPVAREIVDRHGGELRVADGEPGARLVLTLPRLL